MTSTSESATSRVRELSSQALGEIIMGAPVTFVTGKGGVGKTTVATLMSREAFSRGERVLFISLYKDAQTDELLGIPADETTEEIFSSPKLGCDVSVITPSSALVNYLSAKRMGSIITRLIKTGLLDMVANIVPGMRELLVIGDIRAKAESGKWDRIIVDSPSTGHARSLFNVSESANAVARSGVIRKQGDAAREFLRNPHLSQVVVVTLDHAMPLSECREFIFNLEDELHMKIAAVILNKSRVMKTGNSYGIDKNFADIFVPLFAQAPITSESNKKKTLLSRFSFRKKLPTALEENIAFNETVSSCIVLGTGGVGKTTTAAAIALRAARSGKKVALLTIDPARRLGTALGLDDTASRESYVDAQSMEHLSAEKANFHIFQLDSTHEFLDLLKKTLSEAAYKDSQDNTFVSSISKMGIVNEFMAIEAMHRLATSKLYDLVVVDTPPSHHVFDFLEAPEALERMTQSNVYKTLVGAGTMASITTNMALNTIFRPLRGLVGTDLISDAVEFMRTLKDVEEVFAEHSREVVALLASPHTHYVGICNPTSASLEQVSALVRGMREREFRQCSVIVNGVDFTEPNDLDDLAIFATQLSAIDTPVTILTEHELDDPFEIVEAISENVSWDK
ncbi:MAG TPA: ArsA-related P-loop ATPase [Acidimicrobiia bacterium]|nr:ArsA-related P-loop ATPase [Acidimicrobiia bacterium]